MTEPQQSRIPPNVSIRYAYYVSVWRKPHGFMWDNVQGHHAPPIHIHIANWQHDIILIPIDPLTAISMNMVTAEQLEYPPGLLAAFNLLSKEPS